jgi:hypothetical protein
VELPRDAARDRRASRAWRVLEPVPAGAAVREEPPHGPQQAAHGAGTRDIHVVGQFEPSDHPAAVVVDADAVDRAGGQACTGVQHLGAGLQPDELSVVDAYTAGRAAGQRRRVGGRGRRAWAGRHLPGNELGLCAQVVGVERGQRAVDAAADADYPEPVTRRVHGGVRDGPGGIVRVADDNEHNRAAVRRRERGQGGADMRQGRAAPLAVGRLLSGLARRGQPCGSEPGGAPGGERGRLAGSDEAMGADGGCGRV